MRPRPAVFYARTAGVRAGGRGAAAGERGRMVYACMGGIIKNFNQIDGTPPPL